MWVITVFNNQNDIRIYEYENKGEATEALKAFNNQAVLSYTK